jgi:hypothetical protein
MPFNLNVQPYQAPAGQTAVPAPVTSTAGFNLNVQPYQAPGATPPPQKMGSGMAFVDNFNNAVNKLTTGIIAPLFSARAVAQGRSFFANAAAEAEQQHPTASMLGGLAGNIATAIPAAVAMPEMGMLGATGLGAAYGAATLPEGNQTRASNTLFGGAMGAVGGALGALAGKIGEMLPSAKLASAASQGDTNVGLQQAGNRLGVPISPLETNDSLPFQNMVASQLKTNPEQAGQLAKVVAAREGQLQGTLGEIGQSVLKDPQGNPISLEQSHALSTGIYENLKPQIIAPENLTNIVPQADKPNSYIQRLYQAAHSSKSNINFDNVQPGSFEDLLNTNKYIDDRIKTASNAVNGAVNKGVTSGTKSAGEQDLQDAKNTIEQAMSTVDPNGTYPAAKQMVAQQSFVKSLNNAVSGAKLSKPGQTTGTTQDIYNKLLSTSGKQKAFIRSVGSLGGDVQKAQDYATVLNGLQKSPIQGLLGSKAGMGEGVSLKDLGELGIVGHFLGPHLAAAGAGASVAMKASENKGLFNSLFNKALPTNMSPFSGIQQGLNTAGIAGANESTS